MDRWMNKQKDRQTNEQRELTDIKTDTQTLHHIKTDNNFLYLHFPIRNASSVCALFANWNKMKHVTLFHSVLFSICHKYSIKISNKLLMHCGYVILLHKDTRNHYTFMPVIQGKCNRQMYRCKHVLSVRWTGRLVDRQTHREWQIWTGGWINKKTDRQMNR